jgi:hypothetical protein
MDSEDEWAEANGEDLDGDQKMSDDNEDDLAENEEAEGFIVEDDYLSDSELNYSNSSNIDVAADKERRKAIIQKNRESKEKQQREIEPLIFMFSGN